MEGVSTEKSLEIEGKKWAFEKGRDGGCGARRRINLRDFAGEFLSDQIDQSMISVR